MATLKDIIQPIEQEFEKVKEVLKTGLKSDYTELQGITSNLIKMRGKMLRPALSLLSAKLCGEIGERSIAVAATIEYIHSATLVHDDVIDEAYTRHNQLTLSTVLRSHSAVLVGDYMFSKGLTLTSQVKAYEELDITIRAIEALVEGELLQSKGVQTLKVDMAQYMEVAKLKTGSLISAAAQVGAVSVGANEEDRKIMANFGEAVGLAFQIQDDIIDYRPTKNSNKTPYNDVKERKITLPLICAMERGGTQILKDLRAGKTQKVIDFVNKNNGSEGAEKIMNEIIDNAINQLDKIKTSHPEVKESLKMVAYFAGARPF